MYWDSYPTYYELASYFFTSIGLTLELYLEQHEYIPELTETSGYNVAIHNQDSMAYPEDHSVLVAPGVKTHISITKACKFQVTFNKYH